MSRMPKRPRTFDLEALDGALITVLRWRCLILSRKYLLILSIILFAHFLSEKLLESAQG